MQQAAAQTVRIEYVPLDDVIGWGERNPKDHDIDEICAAIRRFGYVDPLIEDGATGRLVSGHGRCEALRVLREDAANGAPIPEGIQVDTAGSWLVPVLRGKSFANEHEAEAYIVATNKLVEAGGWDNGKLTEVLGDLAAIDPDMLIGLGFSDDELRKLSVFEPEATHGGSMKDDPAVMTVTFESADALHEAEQALRELAETFGAKVAVKGGAL